ncbi:hypothetical protein ABXT08_19400 [Chryseobacterium sp. NRRL B-14859]
MENLKRLSKENLNIPDRLFTPEDIDIAGKTCCCTCRDTNQMKV